MNKYLIIGCSVALILVAVLFWQYGKRSRDADLRARLTGTWTATYGSRVLGKMTFAPDGRFTNDFEYAESEGTYRVRNGLLVKATTRTGGTNLPMPIISRERCDIGQQGTNIMMSLESLDSKGKPINSLRPSLPQYWKGTAPFHPSTNLRN
jgi:hypothetical protein